MKHDMAKLIEDYRGRYLMVSALARRVRALQSGAKPLISPAGSDRVDTAMNEFRQGKIEVRTVGPDRLAPDEELPPQDDEETPEEE